MRRSLISLMLLILFVGLSSAQTVTNPLTRANAPKFSAGCKDTRVFCVGKEVGAEYSQISGITVDNADPNRSCDNTQASSSATSAIGAAVASGLCSELTPCEVRVGPGRYDECVSIDNIVGLTVAGSGEGSVSIHPTLTSGDDTAGGIFRVGNVTTTRASTRLIELYGFTVQHDGIGNHEAALRVNREIPTSAQPSPVQDIYIHDVTAIGARYGIGLSGSRLSSDDSPPRIKLYDFTAIGGSQALQMNYWWNADIQNGTLISDTNYCESTDTTHLAAQTGTLVANGNTITAFIEPADDAGVVDFYVGRMLRLSDADGGGAGTCGPANECDGTQEKIGASDPVLDTVTMINGCGATGPTTGCSYVIDAVTHDSGDAYLAGDAIDSPCTSIDWTPLRASIFGNSQGYWDSGCFILGPTATGSSSPLEAVVKLQDITCQFNIDDFGAPAGSFSPCNQHVIQAMIGQMGTTFRSILIRNFHGRMNINSDMDDTAAATCANYTGGMMLIGTAKVEGEWRIENSSITVNNRGDADVNVFGVGAESTAASAGTLTVDDLYVDINNTVAAYAGTSSTFVQSGNSSLQVEQIRSPDAITSSGTIGKIFSDEPGTVCAVIPDLAAADDNFEFWQTAQPATVTDVSCRCRGTCTATATLTLEDRGGNAMTHTAPTCATTGNATYQIVTAGGALVSGEGLAFDVTNTPNPDAADEYTVCIKYRRTGL